MRSPTRRRWSTSRTCPSSQRTDAKMSDVGAWALREIYGHQIAERGFRVDPAQLAAVTRLEELRSRLIVAHESQASLGGRLLRAVGRRSAQTPERGLYLWGPVGRGKTWLMDLFFNSLPF